MNPFYIIFHWNGILMAEYFYYNFPKDFHLYLYILVGFINMNNRESMMQEVVSFR